ncbi:hypothetical protein K458DRAFT_409715 [Lentithecium fluviatile CBS 122367]|uniref:Uncharacterized protein n=1 Tax=Lentithecium fluviatile CBS 122367 TaxID=1168545 RepID=A0A6G1IHY3_9PLEO|nr:hypothetical protein K458DRAFT_409715 [Lentithecium fluviatile CBS 122367]
MSATKTITRRDEAFKAFTATSPRTRLVTEKTDTTSVSASKNALSNFPSTPISWAGIASCLASKPQPKPEIKLNFKATAKPETGATTKSKPKTKDPFAHINLNPSPLPTWAEIFDVERMEEDLVAMKAAGAPNAYSEQEKQAAGPTVQRGFMVKEKVNLGLLVGWPKVSY